MVSVLLTGGAGYIGAKLTPRLLFQDKVTVYDSLLYDKTSLLQNVGHPGFRFVKGDVRDHDKLLEEIKKHDVIIHLAALVGFPLCDQKPQEAKDVNFEASKFIAQTKSKDQQLIFPMTNSGYGATDGSSIVTEKDPLNPITLYGQTKVRAERAIKQTENHITMRLATVFGSSPRMRTDLLVNNFVLKAMRDKLIVLYECEFMRNYVHIQDVCEALEFILDNWDKCKNETYNVGNDELNMNKLQLAKKIKEHLPLEIIKAEFTSDPDKRNYIVSSQKFYDKGFKCDYDLDDGIKELIQSYELIDGPWFANY